MRDEESEVGILLWVPLHPVDGNNHRFFSVAFSLAVQ
jgi:hypothetical protein